MTTVVDFRTSRGPSAIPSPDGEVRLQSVIGRLRLVAAFATIGIAGAAALLLWLAPWPVDGLVAGAAAAAWASWLDKQDRA